MKEIILVTGNPGKAAYFSKYLGLDIKRVDIDLDEIQSLDGKEIVRHKVIEAYSKINKPVIVEDVGLEFEALGRLPGPFIKFFLKELSLQELCDLLKDKNRRAVARCVIGYYDGSNLELFEGSLNGVIAESPIGDNGYGWDKIFIPDGYNVTRAQLDEEDDRKTYLQFKRMDLLKQYLLEEKR